MGIYIMSFIVGIALAKLMETIFTETSNEY